MDLLIPSQTPALKSYMETQIFTFTDLSNRLFTSAQKLSELNMQVARTLMEEGTVVARQLMAAEGSAEFISIAVSQITPAAEKACAYQQHLTNIVADTRLALTKATEEHLSETTKTAETVADEMAQKASEETEKLAHQQKTTMEKMTHPCEITTDGRGGPRIVPAK